MLISVMGLSHYSGILYNRCRLNPEPETSFSWEYDQATTRVCSLNGLGLYECPTGLTCGNPDEFNFNIESDNVESNHQISYGLIGFDNFGTSMMTVF